MSSAIATVLAATGLMTTATWASDREIYQRGGEGSVAVMMMLDVSRTMRQKFGTLDDGSSDYYGCVHSIDREQVVSVGEITFPVRYCTYTEGTMNFNEFFLRKKFPSYREYIKQTCDYVPDGTILGNPEYRCYDRLTRAKIALLSLLNGNSERQIAALSNDKVIGLSVFPAFLYSDEKFDSQSGSVRVAARRLDAEVAVGGTKLTQRQLLIDEILKVTELPGTQGLWKNLFESDEVPIAPAYADTAAALMGTSTTAGFREVERVGIDWLDKKNLWNYQFVQDNGLLNWNGLRSCRKASNTAIDPSNWNEYGQCGGWLNRENSSALFNPDYSDMYSINQRLGLSLTSDTATFLANDSNKKTKYSGMYNASSDVLRKPVDSASNTYIAPEIVQNQVKNPALQQCHAQGIYMITGGLSKIRDLSQGDGPANFYIKRMMNRSLDANENLDEVNFRNNFCANGKLENYRGDNYTENTSWDCISEYAERLKSGNNPVNLNIKTAVVGVGKQFASMPSVNLFESEQNSQESIDKALDELESYNDKGSLLFTKSTRHNLKNTALLGVYGGGGWYSAMSVGEIADSFNSFVNSLAQDIPSASANKAIIPVDILNPYELQPYAYLAMYEPTVQKASSLWAGNLKRYGIGQKGLIVDQEKSTIFEDNGLVKNSSKDLWENSPLSDSEKLKARLFQGGALNELKLGHSAGGALERKIYTTRECLEQDDAVLCKQNDKVKLNRLDKNYFTDNISKNDQYRGYLLGLLGYDIANPKTISDEEIQDLWQYKQPELRQMGAILHSDPVLLTQKGKVIRSGTQIVSEDREDYVLFGTTQGVLHVLDADTGEEKFAFVPDEMVKNNHPAFINPNLSEGAGKFLYGIDGAWTVYSEYIPANQSDQTLTVGKNQASNLSGKQWVYGGLRMGGSSYYALDLSDINQPSVKFHIDPQTHTVYTPTGSKEYSALKYMGQSWSKPVITRVNWQGEDKLVMIVGGGYDDTGKNNGYEDPQYAQNADNRRGAGVYMFDAEKGDLLWWASSNVNYNQPSAGDDSIGSHVDALGYSVVSTIKTVDRDGDSLTDHLYFGDLGGQFWRIDLNNFPKTGTDPKDPKKKITQPFAAHIVRLLNLRSTTTQSTKTPRFYTQPTFSIHRIPGSGRVLAAISIGTGNASTPLHNPIGEENWVPNAIYTIFDKDVTRSNLYQLPTEQLRKDLELEELSADRRKDLLPAFDENINGWKFTFYLNPFSLSNDSKNAANFYSSPMGAKVITDPVLMDNQLFFSVFDSERSGTVQSCDAGIRGESVIERFCMPFGTCTSKNGLSNSLYAGVGIVPINVSSGGVGSQNSRTIINSQCEGDSCKTHANGQDIGKNNLLNRKLRPLRWYERE